MASELSIVIKASALIGSTLAALRSLSRGVDGVRHSVQELEREQLRLQRTMRLSGATDGISRLQSNLQSVGRSLQGLHANATVQTRIAMKMDNLREARAQMKSEVLGTVASLGVVLAPVKLAMDFETAMADVRSKVDFDTPAQFKAMQHDLLQLTHTMPIAAADLAKIAAAGGQLGVARQDITSFTTQIAKMSVAFDISADEAATSMAKLANVYQIPIAQIGTLGDAINDLSNNSPATAANIVNVLGRVAGVAKTFGLTELQVTSLSNAFISLGKTPEVASTAINGMLTQLITADSQGAKFQATLKQMGLSAEELKRNISQNGEQALVDFLQRINQLPQADRMGALVNLFGRQYADDIAVLAGGVDQYRFAIERLQKVGANGSPQFAGSMGKEYQARMATTAAQWQTFKNQLIHLGISIGTVVLPAINSLLSDIKPLVAQFIRFSESHPALIRNIFMGIAAFAGLKAGSLGLRFALNILQTSILGTGGQLFNLFGSVLRLKSAFSLLRMGRAVTALRLLGLSTQQARSAMRLFSGSLNIVRSVFAGLGRIIMGVIRFLPMLGQAFMTLGRFLLLNPIGIALGLMATAAYLLYTRWDGVVGGAKALWQDLGEFFSGLWNTISTLFQTAWASIQTFFNSGIANISATIINWSPLGLFYQAFSAVMGWFGITLPATFTGFGRMLLDGLINGIRSRVAAVVEMVGSVAARIKNAFTSSKSMDIHSPSRVFTRFGGYIMEGLHLGLNRAAPRPIAAIGQVATDLQQRFTNRAGMLSADMAARLQANSAELAAARQAQASASLQQGMTIHFNPTIHAPNGDVSQIQTALQMGMREFEALFNRLMAERERRAY